MQAVVEGEEELWLKQQNHQLSFSQSEKSIKVEGSLRNNIDYGNEWYHIWLLELSAVCFILL